VALGVNLALIGEARIYLVTLIAQLALVLAAALSPLTGGRFRLFALCYYYLLVTASLGAGLWDWLRKGTSPAWEKAEGRG
jgi:hypothetical protein